MMRTGTRRSLGVGSPNYGYSQLLVPAQRLPNLLHTPSNERTIVPSLFLLSVVLGESLCCFSPELAKLHVKPGKHVLDILLYALEERYYRVCGRALVTAVLDLGELFAGRLDFLLQAVQLRPVCWRDIVEPGERKCDLAFRALSDIVNGLVVAFNLQKISEMT